MKLQHDQTILFTGDSITACGRLTAGDSPEHLGEGYVAFSHALLGAGHPERDIRVLNTGIGGHRVTDLEARWQKDVLDLAPDWLSVKIGINDVWRQVTNASEPDQVPIDRYETIYRRLLEQTRPTLKGLVLMTPYVLEPDRSDPFREMMDAYGAVVKQFATDFDAILVDTQAPFDAYLAHRSNTTLCEDRVHPNKTGHMILAQAFLTAMDFDWSRMSC